MAAAGAGPSFRVSDLSSKGRGAGGNSNSDGTHDDLYDGEDGSRRPSQVPQAARRAAISSYLVTGWLFNAARETSPPSAGPGPVACGYGTGIAVAPTSLPRALAGAGGPAMLFPLLQRAQSEAGLCAALRLIGLCVKSGGAASAAYMQTGGGYLILAGLLRTRRAILGPDTVRVCFEMAVDRAYDGGRASGKGRRAEAGGVAGGAGGGGGERDEDRPWGSEDDGRGGDAGKETHQQAEKEAKRRKAACAWGWEKENVFMPRRWAGKIFGGSWLDARGEDGSGAGRDEPRLCPFVLLTDPYALKNLVMNHQVCVVAAACCLLLLLVVDVDGDDAASHDIDC